MREMEQSWKEKGQDGVYVVAEKTKDWVRFERAMWEVDDKVVEAFGTMDRVLLEKRQYASSATVFTCADHHRRSHLDYGTPAWGDVRSSKRSEA
ncbi:hypothetical protein PWT90_11239 [Aphanocladium album]|nr:hypothetical protein PWT90_11239 [Aphanocladium album]